jgi:hypothetical protein
LQKTKHKGVALSPRNFLHLRTLLTGAIYSGERLWKGKQVSDPVCAFCHAESENVEHLLWQCSAWHKQRAKLFSKSTEDFLAELPTCTRQCGVILNDIFPAQGQRKNFAHILQSTFIDILEAREKVRATQHRETDPVPEPLDRQDDPVDIRALNPTAFTRNELFPTYPWDWEHHDSTLSFQNFFQGDVPNNWRRFSSSSEWIYGLDLFSAMVWYFRQLTWPTNLSHRTITWCELTIDFQAATHTHLFNIKWKSSWTFSPVPMSIWNHS